MTECSMCGRRGDIRAMRQCGLCGALICDECAERGSGVCDECAGDERDEW